MSHMLLGLLTLFLQIHSLGSGKWFEGELYVEIQVSFSGVHFSLECWPIEYCSLDSPKLPIFVFLASEYAINFLFDFCVLYLDSTNAWREKTAVNLGSPQHIFLLSRILAPQILTTFIFNAFKLLFLNSYRASIDLCRRVIWSMLLITDGNRIIQ